MGKYHDRFHAAWVALDDVIAEIDRDLEGDTVDDIVSAGESADELISEVEDLIEKLEKEV